MTTALESHQAGFRAIRSAHLTLLALTAKHETFQLLKTRGLSLAIIARWNIGFWHPQLTWDTLDHMGVDRDLLNSMGLNVRLSYRFTFPLLSPTAVVQGAIGRRYRESEVVKYLYPDNSLYFDQRSHLYGIHTVSQSDQPGVLVEGPMDAILGQERAEIPAVGSHHSTFTQEQALILRSVNSSRCYLMPDGDVGLTNFQKSAERHRSSLPDEVLLVKLPPGSDPASLLVEKAGPNIIQQAMAKATLI